VSRRRLVSEPNVHLTGARPYQDIPAYLQHADVIVVPHLVNEFTESLDPIKAYECLAVDSPTIATPIAGFRDLCGSINIAPRHSFVSVVTNLLDQTPDAVEKSRNAKIPSWEERAAEFEEVLAAVGSKHNEAA
jgi:teichuronic acid biosynthesis glycosyltransferase TuaH